MRRLILRAFAMPALRSLLFVSFSTMVILSAWSCKHSGGGDLTPNQSPIIRLSNVPPLNDIITTPNPRVTLSWVGDDPDGYVIAYKYRWTFTIGGVEQVHQWSTILNITLPGGNYPRLALLLDSTQEHGATEKIVYPVYHYLATLPTNGLDSARLNGLVYGDTELIAGVKVYAADANTEAFPVHQNPNSGTFIFDSQDSLNFHKFEVVAIDNNSTVSAKPAFVYFNTPKVPGPLVQITGGPQINLQTGTNIIDTPRTVVFTRRGFTDTFGGLLFNFSAVDPNSRTINYSWMVDSTLRWSDWSEQTYALVTSQDFANPLDTTLVTKHVFYLRAENEFGTISYSASSLDSLNHTVVVPAVRPFMVVSPKFLQPNFSRRMLVVNISFCNDSINTRYSLSENPAHPDSMHERIFYQDSVLNRLSPAYPYDYVGTWHQAGPSRVDLARYNIVMVIGDVVNQNTLYDISLNAGMALIAELNDYCAIGGNLITSSYAMSFALSYGKTTYLSALCHAQLPPISLVGIGNVIQCGSSIINPFVPYFDNAYEDVGARGVVCDPTCFPDVSVESARLDTAWHQPGSAIQSMNFYTVLLPRGFGEYLYQIKTLNPETSCYESQNCGVLYKGVTYSSIFYGFPLYYMKASDDINVVEKSLQEIGQ